MTADLLTRVIAIVQHELDTTRAHGSTPHITAETELVKDLRCCAVDYQCFAMEFDERFGVEIPDRVLDEDSAERWRTPEDMARTVRELPGATDPITLSPPMGETAGERP